jgi:uncharacterized protein
MSIDAQIAQGAEEPTMLDTEPGPPSDLPACDLIEPGAPATSPDQLAEPVSSSERYFAVDVLRGFALLGILAMNIVAFAWPFSAYDDPPRGGGFTGLDRAVWFGNHLVFEDKMMTIFSMLFGAGLILMDQRAQARGAGVRGIYYRRILWLFAIGLVHSYLIWLGDILVLYAQCGLLLYLFRKLKPHTLLIVGFCCLLILVPLDLGFARWIDVTKAASDRAEAQIQAGQKPSPPDQRAHDIWAGGVREWVAPSPEQQAKSWATELRVYRGGYLGIVKHRAPFVFMVQTMVAFLFGTIFFALGRMLLGMGLMKLGVFSAERSKRFYLWMVGLGYGIGLPLMVFDALELIRHDFSMSYKMHGGSFYNMFGSLVVASGHVGLVMLIVQSGALGWLTRRLAAVGRMALSNYLTHSLICTTLFYGYGFGLFGHINRAGLVAVVLAIWIFQLIVSRIWLEYFRFGPAEWVWRSLTYWRLQPMWAKREQALTGPSPMAA